MDTEDNFAQIGGVRLDTVNLTWPFAKIIVDRQGIILKAFNKPYYLEKKKITALREYKGIISKGLLIEHTYTVAPHHMVFWSFNLQRLKEKIERLGYAVGPLKKSDAWWQGGP